MGWARFLCLLCAIALGACAEEGLTQLVVHVDSDLAVPEDMDGITIDVAGAVQRTSAEASLTGRPLPRTIGLVHRGGPLGPITITARGWLGSDLVVEQSVSSSFVSGTTRRVDLRLEVACVDVECATDASCQGGECVALGPDAPLPTEANPPGDAGTPGDPDAGPAEDAGDGGPTPGTGNDGGPDAAPDAGPSPLESIAVTQEVAALPAGREQNLTATGTYENGDQADLSEQVSWASDNESVATVDASGTVLAVAPGMATITATLNGVDGTTVVRVTAAELELIAVTPIDSTMPKGTAEGFTAAGTYSDDSIRDLTTQVTWRSDDPAAATVSNDAGIEGQVRAVTEGQARITATLADVSGGTTVTVGPAALVSLTVDASDLSFAAGTAGNLTATGTFTDGTKRAVTREVTWESDVEAVATVSNEAGSEGFLMTVAPGQSTIAASLDGIRSSLVVTVTDAVLTAVSVEPVDPVVPLGLTAQLAATGLFSDGRTQDLTAQASWSSQDEDVATVSPEGLVNPIVPGGTRITASFETIDGSTLVTVTDASLDSIEVVPEQASISVGTSVTFTALGTFSDGSSQNLTTQVSWSSSATDVARVSNDPGSEGLTSGLAEGQADITASLDGVVAQAQLSVTATQLETIVLIPAAASVAAGTEKAFQAVGMFSDGGQQDLTDQVLWASSDTAVATIGNAVDTGIATGVGPGTSDISATLNGVVGQAELTVTDAALESITVLPTTQTLLVGGKQQYTATGTFSDGSEQDITAAVAWSAEPAGVASISNLSGSRGLATGLSAGDTSIVASLDDRQGAATLSVSSETLESIVLTPANSTVPVTTQQQFAATGVYSGGSEQDLTASVTWSSDDESILGISNAADSKGLATGQSAGQTTVRASFGGVNGSTGVEVLTITLESIAIAPPDPSIAKGDSLQMTATGTFSNGDQRDLTSQVAWSVDDNRIASVSTLAGSKGEVSAQKKGTTTLHAELDGVATSTSISVTTGGGPGN